MQAVFLLHFFEFLGIVNMYAYRYLSQDIVF